MAPNWKNSVPLLNEQFVTQTAYDALNRPTAIIHPDATEVSYQYDKGGLLQKVFQNATEHITNITYNPKGQRENIYYGNNTKTRYDYNPLNFRLTRLLSTRNAGQDVLQDLNYDYDPVGNITKITDDAQQVHYFNNQVIAPVAAFEYDALYRLTKATGRELTALTAPNENDFANNISCPNNASNAMQNYVHNYEYDLLGNMLSDAWKTYQYASLNNYLLGNDNIANQFTYDPHGNTTLMSHLSLMSYDSNDNLFSAGNGTFTSYYNYDAQGNRTRKIVEKGNIIETRYYINGYEVYRKVGTVNLERTTINISDGEKVFARIETESGQNPVIRYQYDNHLGSACLELDFQGAIISYEEYHPFGTTSYRSGKNETEVSQKRYKYNGKERDEETGLYAYGMRYYAAWLCRFISVDPMQFKYPELTPFQYASNNPVTMIDLDGAEGVKPPVASQQKNAPQKAQPTIKETIEAGKKKSATFAVLLNLNEINLDNCDKTISFNNYQTETDLKTGKITLTQSNDIKSQVIKLAHELTNRKYIEKAREAEKQVTEGNISAKDYAIRLAYIEIAGQINQIKVAAEIGYRYEGPEFEALNQLIDKYSNGEVTVTDLRKHFKASDNVHLKTYEERGEKMRERQIQKEETNKKHLN